MIMMMMMMMMMQVVPQFTVFSGMPPHIAHLKLKPGVSPSFFMHDELKMVCTAVLQYNNVIKTGSRCSGSNRKHTIPVWYSTNWSCRINV